ncbi:helix-turn-helix transcriptional regulator [Sphingosinicella sp. LHD-64]|uniref:helix-turn-helix transcriptional regulator n=1 Tax=Sphingosinicella sp. LHD-64 TaxID=3072139 RepID=UPI00280EEBD7|nr:helix-turn-helix transcriptional regulator [Sphingosinicella sp. LHD-64]MDQ8757803.1 helix-turn-helix transcriptional regulator [Sphingosinicella sp. LHD-64]
MLRTAFEDEATPPGAISPAEQALTWLGSDAWPRLLVDNDLRLLWYNPAARKMLGASACLVLRGGCIAVADPGHQDLLEALIQSADDDERVRAFRSDIGGEHFALQAQRLSHVTVGLQVRLLDVDISRRNDRHLREMFRLTRAEHLVLQSMLDGHTADEISRQRGSSIETVRTQIRNIYVKVGVSSRERLFRTVQPLLFS